VDPLLVIALSSVLCVYSVRLGHPTGFLRGHGGVCFAVQPVCILSHDPGLSRSHPSLFTPESLSMFAPLHQIRRRGFTISIGFLMASLRILLRILFGIQEPVRAKAAHLTAYDRRRRRSGEGASAPLSSWGEGVGAISRP
jgi:hypothetical protein